MTVMTPITEQNSRETDRPHINDNNSLFSHLVIIQYQMTEFQNLPVAASEQTENYRLQRL